MYDRWNGRIVKSFNLEDNNVGRNINARDIYVPAGYSIEAFAQGLDTPSSILFTPDGDLYIASTGYITGSATVSRYNNGRFELIADGFNVPLTGITSRDGDIFVSHRGVISVIRRDGTIQDILTGLPSYGDYSNSRVSFGIDSKMYFGIGTATNSGVVGLDNNWVKNYPFFHDNPGSYVILNGQNFETRNLYLETANEPVLTGAYSPYGVSNIIYEVRKGVTKASGSILRANPDGTDLELFAWGLRSPSYCRFDEQFRLFVSNNGCDIRGSRPIANAPDEFQLITPGVWYGWPDYAGGEPVTSPRFKPEGGQQPEFLFTNHPNLPPRPYAMFPQGSTIIGFDFNYNSNFGPRGDVYIAEFGAVRPNTIRDIAPLFTGSGHRVSKIDMVSGGVTTFAINKSGFPAHISREGGFGRPADIAFGPDGAMYIVDMGTNYLDNLNSFIPNTGVIWRVTRN
ncbi:MAG: repeat containing protein [Herbinix sp.]|jgi:glucose/arabinose dehydrogenase|nr:repeat containing protein [Herbinix sp.]